MNMAIREEIKERPNLSILALVSFAASFIVARTFTTLYPNTVLVSGNYHIHHFWYGLALLVIGGWLGISLENPRINRLAAILFGAGGGLIGDEIGLLLTLNDYWTNITYTAIVIFLTFASILSLLFRYKKTILAEFAQFTRTNASVYFAIFIAAISLAFILETDNTLIIIISCAVALMSCMVILAYFAQRLLKTRRLSGK
jgi:hypothetical protein